MIDFDAYRDSAFGICPFCQSEDIKELPILGFKSGSQYRHILICAECEQEWLECFEMVGIESPESEEESNEEEES